MVIKWLIIAVFCLPRGDRCGDRCNMADDGAVNVTVRVDGRDEKFEADWIKYLTIKAE